MKNKEVDQVAEEIYSLMSDLPDVPFKQARTTCQAFYRHIARWHLQKRQEYARSCPIRVTDINN